MLNQPGFLPKYIINAQKCSVTHKRAKSHATSYERTEMRTFSKNNGFTVEDMLHVGFGHVDAACMLFNGDPEYFDSAGYLAHLGTELVFKAWHLQVFGKFSDSHKLRKMYNELKVNNSDIDLGTENESFLSELDKFYSLRYPRRNEGPIEVGADMLNQYERLIDSMWKLFPIEMIKIYNKINPTRKAGRVLMEKKI